jgi:hypothetical protein
MFGKKTGDNSDNMERVDLSANQASRVDYWPSRGELI